MSTIPTDDQIRATIKAAVAINYDSIKAFAREMNLPYDRVTDHLGGYSQWRVADMLDYARKLGLSWDDLASGRVTFDTTRHAPPTSANREWVGLGG